MELSGVWMSKKEAHTEAGLKLTAANGRLAHQRANGRDSFFDSLAQVVEPPARKIALAEDLARLLRKAIQTLSTGACA